MLVLKLPSPLYTAVIEWVPGVRLLIGRLVWPALRATVPKVVVPSLKVTVPVGVPDPGALAVTVAVNVTVWPNTDGLDDEAKRPEVAAALTVMLEEVPVIELLTVSVPVIVCDPAFLSVMLVEKMWIPLSTAVNA